MSGVAKRLHPANPTRLARAPVWAARREGRRRTPRRWPVIVGIVTGIMAGVAGGCGVAWLQNSGAPTRYLTAEVDRGNVAVVLAANGDLRAAGSVSVRARVAGRVRALLVADNASVKAGQVLATIDADDARARPRAHPTGGARLRALARQLEESIPALAARAHALDQLLRSTRDSIAAADAKAAPRGDAATIVSPIDGVIVSHALHVGQRISPADELSPVFVVAPGSDLELHVALDEADVGAVYEGQEAQFTFGAYRNRRFTGKVAKIVRAPRPIQGSAGYETIIRVPNPEHNLWPGMTASIRLTLEPRRQVVRIPNGVLRQRFDDGATRAESSRPVLYRISDGEPRPVEVELGVSDDTFTEVVSGLLTGDMIVTGVVGGTKEESSSPTVHS